MATTSLSDPGTSESGIPESIISRWRHLQLLKTLLKMGVDIANASSFLDLDRMPIYITSFWKHFDPQFPILHKPTFAVEETHDLLLLAIFVTGAQILRRIQGEQTTDTSPDFVIASNLRYEIYKMANSTPLVLWIPQALLILEVYEMLCPTREIYRRECIHHDMLINLIQEAGWLTEPPSTRAEPSWFEWAQREGARRVVFATFYLDLIHALTFSRPTKIIVFGMHRRLPCDNAFWSAVSAEELSRVVSSRGREPQPFLRHCLDQVLQRQLVLTNPFGSNLVMASLLSMIWSRKQQELHVSLYGMTLQLDHDWRSTLLCACGYWKQGLDEAYRTIDDGQPLPQAGDIMIESGTILYHLAYMVANVDIAQCQVYAGAGLRLGRDVSPSSYAAIAHMVKLWARGSSAPSATFYALKFLSRTVGSASYSARHDVLLHRPWALYLAALIVWCYGYAREGFIKSESDLSTPAARKEDMDLFLKRANAVQSPDALQRLDGHNKCLGLLMELKEIFGCVKSAMLDEANALLENCCMMLQGG
jgi:hypothetical protein